MAVCKFAEGADDGRCRRRGTEPGVRLTIRSGHDLKL